MRRYLVSLALCLPSLAGVATLIVAIPALARSAAPSVGSSYYWTVLGDEQLALWRRDTNTQIGVYLIATGTYYPRLGPGKFGVPEDPPASPPDQYVQKRDARGNWRTSGVTGPAGNGNGIPDTGLHVRTSPKRAIQHSGPMPGAVQQAASAIPAFSTMPSITFVSKDKDGAAADAALKQFRTAPELAKWREKYGARAKAYSADDFAHTGAAFKLDQDRTFQQTGFVALVQATPPDANDKAVVRSIYSFTSPAQFLSALRDADSGYDPNPLDPPPDSPLAILGTWEPWHMAAAGSLAAVALAVSGGTVVLRRRMV